MSVTVVARRYAEALADVAMARGQVEQIESELRAFAEMISANRELYEVFASPIISQSDKARVLQALIERARPGQMTANLLATMLRHYRLHHIQAVYQRFRHEINERRGIAIAEITTASAVGEAERDILGRQLQQMTGKRVQLQFKSDPSLIGGVVTRIGSVIYDGSIKTQLQAVKQRLKQGGNI
jgi:F-type H+-transporting ATPase subunit delta